MRSNVVAFELNGDETQVIARPLTSLQSVLRDQLGLTATKAGCRQGGCGSCSVLIDGRLSLSCLIPIADVEGCRVETVEGMAGPELHPIQAAFLERFAVQCGFCTPGMVMATRALLDSTPHPTREEIEEAISGNVCRCTGYQAIIAAIEEAAR